MDANLKQSQEKWNILWGMTSLMIQRIEESMGKLPAPTLFRELLAMLPPQTSSLQKPAHRLIYLDSQYASELSEMLGPPLDQDRLLYANRATHLLALWRMLEIQRFVGLHVNDAFDAHSTIFPFPTLSESQVCKWLANKWWEHAGRDDAARRFEAEMQLPSYAG